MFSMLHVHVYEFRPVRCYMSSDLNTPEGNLLVLNLFELMKGKALRKHSLHEKTAASVLLKPFIMTCNTYMHKTQT